MKDEINKILRLRMETDAAFIERPGNFCVMTDMAHDIIKNLRVSRLTYQECKEVLKAALLILEYCSVGEIPEQKN